MCEQAPHDAPDVDERALAAIPARWRDRLDRDVTADIHVQVSRLLEIARASGLMSWSKGIQTSQSVPAVADPLRPIVVSATALNRSSPAPRAARPSAAQAPSPSRS